MKNLEEKALFFKALAEPIRLKIIGHLLERKDCTCICELARLIRRDQSVVFRHVQILKNAGILSAKKEGKCLMCCLREKEYFKGCLEG